MDKLFASKTKRKRNLSKEENEALKWLSTNDDIIIKRADKGGAVVAWDRDQYITEALRQLPLMSNPTELIKAELKEMLLHAKDQGWISQNEHDFLLCENPRIPSFYMLPKVHKNLETPLEDQ